MEFLRSCALDSLLDTRPDLKDPPTLSPESRFLHTGAMFYPRRTTNRHAASQRLPPMPKVKQLPYNPKVDRKLQQDEEWRAVANLYLLDPKFTEGIQSLNLKDPEMLEKAVHFVKIPSSLKMRMNLFKRAKGLMDDYDRYSKSSEADEYSGMWLCMAVVVFQTVMWRKAAYPENFRELVDIFHHYLIVTALLLEILADWESPPDSYLRHRYLFDIDDNNEGAPESSGQKRKRDAEEQTSGNKTHAGPRTEAAEEVTREVGAGSSISSDHGDETTAEHSNVGQDMSQAAHSKNRGQQTSQKNPTATEAGSVAPQPTQSDGVASIPYLDTHHSSQQPAAPTAPTAPTAVMFVPTQHEEQDGTRSVQDLEGSATNIIAEGEGTATEGLRSMLDEERKMRQQAEQRASDERKKRKQAKKDTKSRIHDLEQAEQKAKGKRKQAKQKAKVRVRELEEKLKHQEASSSSGKHQTK